MNTYMNMLCICTILACQSTDGIVIEMHFKVHNLTLP